MLLSIIEKEDHCTDLYIYLIQNNVKNENKSEWVREGGSERASLTFSYFY